MSLFLPIHPDNPQARLIKQAADIFRQGGIGILPTDAAYVIGCHLDDKTALQRIQKIRQLDKHVEGGDSHFISRLSDRRQRRASHLRELQVIKADDGKIVRHLKAAVPGRGQGGQRTTVIHRNQSRREVAVPGLQTLPDRLVGVN